MGHTIGVDIGGTKVAGGVVDETGHILARARVETPAKDASAAEDAIVAVVEKLRGDFDIEAVGLGIAGFVDESRSRVYFSPNLPDWHNEPVRDDVSRRVGLPVVVENDANAAAWGENRFGAGRDETDLVCVTVGTGIGGGIIIDARPLIGLDGTAGEIGHMTVDIDGPLCGDGMPGHAEAIGSGTAIAREGRALLDRGGSSVLADLAGSAEVDAALVARAADQGDAACTEILERAYEAVGAMCASLVNALNPEVIVLGGSIADKRPRLHVVARAEVDHRAFPAPAARVRIEPASFGDDVSLIGSLPIVNERLRDPAYRQRRSLSEGASR